MARGCLVTITEVVQAQMSRTEGLQAQATITEGHVVVGHITEVCGDTAPPPVLADGWATEDGFDWLTEDGYRWLLEA